LFINDLQGFSFFCCQICCRFRTNTLLYSSSLVSVKVKLMAINSLISSVVALTEPLGLSIGFPLVPFLNGIVNLLFE